MPIAHIGNRIRITHSHYTHFGQQACGAHLRLWTLHWELLDCMDRRFRSGTDREQSTCRLCISAIAFAPTHTLDNKLNQQACGAHLWLGTLHWEQLNMPRQPFSFGYSPGMGKRTCHSPLYLPSSTGAAELTPSWLAAMHTRIVGWSSIDWIVGLSSWRLDLELIANRVRRLWILG